MTSHKENVAAKSAGAEYAVDAALVPSEQVLYAVGYTGRVVLVRFGEWGKWIQCERSYSSIWLTLTIVFSIAST